MGETTGNNITDLKAKNTRILVNFLTRKVVQSNFNMNSKEYRGLLKKGYEFVGMIKGSPSIFWSNDFFNPEDKYMREVKDEKTIIAGNYGIPDNSSGTGDGI